MYHLMNYEEEGNTAVRILNCGFAVEGPGNLPSGLLFSMGFGERGRTNDLSSMSELAVTVQLLYFILPSATLRCCLQHITIEF